MNNVKNTDKKRNDSNILFLLLSDETLYYKRHNQPI